MTDLRLIRSPRLNHAEYADVAIVRADREVLVVATEPEQLGAAWTVVREHFGDHEVPATLQGVPVLGYPGQLVELEPIAARSPR